MEAKVTFLSGNYEIEGLLEKGSEERGVIVTHPHPLYGGDMYNPVVSSIVRAYRNKAYTTLRLNFRGVGSSQGSHDDGIGEQDDVLAAYSFLTEMGLTKIDIAGYSFGSWVNAHAVGEHTGEENMIMVSPPVGFMDFTGIKSLSSLKLVVTGSMDDIAPADHIQKLMESWNPDAEFTAIGGADHFYSGYAEDLEKIIQASL